ncbi:MAG: 50S ribosomal protein L22 [Verrucomicrobiia bacterium]
MEVQSIHKYARISAFKARQVGREIQGKSVAAALDLCRFTPLKAARLFEKTLQSAIANAENNHNLKSADLIIKEAVVGEGPTIKRYTSRARGSGSMIRKRTSHIRVTLIESSDKAPVLAENKPAEESAATAEKPKRKKSAPKDSPASKE